MDNNISFTANLINTTKIKKLSYGFYKKVDASFVELNRNDLSVLQETTQQWEQLFSNAIYSNAKDKLKNYKNVYHVYALTTQKREFTKLEPKKILGLVEYQQGPTYDEINLLQINPKYKNNERNFLDKIKNFFKNNRNEYQGSGTGIINSLKKLYKYKTINVESATASTGFYERNGFKSVYENGAYYTWNIKKNR